MKIRVLCLLSIFAFFIIACEESDSESQSLRLSESSFNDVSSGGDVLEVEIVCNSSWKMTSSPQWCTFDATEGKGDHLLNITVIANIESSERVGEITITSGTTKKTIQVRQQASIAIEEFHYKLPVIFHVLYSDSNKELQYVNKGWMAQLLNAVNKYYKGSGISPDMNLEFTLATAMPKTGEKLDEPGVERIRWDKDYPIDYEAFMTNNDEKYTYLLWDPNQYINIMVYNFKQSSETNVTLGVSHLPFATKDNPLDGLTVAPKPQLVIGNLKYPHCVSINSSFIYELSSDELYSTTDVVATLAHELGHYLGLHHVFSDTPADPCADTDYCDDTPSYNKSQYDEYYMDAYENRYTQPQKWTMKYLVKRYSCDGSWFDSRNLMDYAFSYSDQFSADQNARVRHVLTYSPLVPGPKKGQSSTRSVASEEPLDLPIRIAK